MGCRFVRNRARRSARYAIVATVIALHAVTANAEVWGYIDEQGVSHFATYKQDERYQLFYRGGSTLDPPPANTDSSGKAALERSTLYHRVIDHPNVRRFTPLIEQQAKLHAVDPALVKAVIAVESAFDPDAVSPKGALGLMQVIPATGARYGLTDDKRRTVEQKLLDPATNVRIGVRYLRDLLHLFADDLALALAAYNAGEEAVRQNGNRIPPYPETQDYVSLVRQFEALYQPPKPLPAPPLRPRLRLPARGLADAIATPPAP